MSGSPYAITHGSLAATSGYALSFVDAGTLTVGQRAVTVTANAQTRAYGDANPALSYSTTSLGAGSALTGTLATPATATSDVGTYAITQGSLLAAANPNYALTYVGNTLTVGQRAVTVTADAQTRAYGDANPALSYTVGGRSLVNGDGLTGGLATNATIASDIGTYAIGQGSLAASANYAVSYVGADLGVTARTLTLTANAQTRAVYGANPLLTYTIGGRGLANGDILLGSLSTDATALSAVGRYTVAQGTLVANANYALAFTPGLLTVTETAAETITIAPAFLASIANRSVQLNSGFPFEPAANLLTGAEVAIGQVGQNSTSFGFSSLTDPRFDRIVACIGSGTACVVAPRPVPRPQASR